VIKELAVPGQGWFVGPVVIRVRGIADLEREVFGPVLHVATFKAGDLDAVIDAVNATGYGLTFGLHSRIDDRVQRIVDRIRVGNTYVNRNQIGAVVGSQPFGGEGLSGTGPKAGGPAYLARFTRGGAGVPGLWDGPANAQAVQVALARVQVPQGALSAHDLPGPTGESNRLTTHARGPILCMGPGAEAVAVQAAAVRAAGGVAVEVQGALDPAALTSLQGFAAVVWWGMPAPVQAALAARPGPILPMVAEMPDKSWVRLERHVCIDTTAAGGNAQLLAGAA
jgi:RHH-type proline utilization regulon transcriptional repressor/proline dehydrogenase/delta 1-pyrroline-5-carboxylate dehydrogenase